MPHCNQAYKIKGSHTAGSPFFDRFELAPSKLNEKKIKLEWRQKGSDAWFDADTLSSCHALAPCLKRQVFLKAKVLQNDLQDQEIAAAAPAWRFRLWRRRFESVPEAVCGCKK